MDREQRDIGEVKRRLVAELDAARRGLTSQVSLARVELSPVTLARRSFDKHRWIWIAGGAFAGVVLIRFLLPGNFRSDNFGKPARKRGVFGMVSGLAFGLATRAATNFVSEHLKEHAQNYLHTILNRQGPV